MKYMDDHLGFIGDDDEAYVMDDYGYLTWVPFSLPSAYFQSAD
jgi:hypothetical protein